MEQESKSETIRSTALGILTEEKNRFESYKAKRHGCLWCCSIQFARFNIQSHN